MNLFVETFDREHGLKFAPDNHPAEWFTSRDYTISQQVLAVAGAQPQRKVRQRAFSS